MNIFNQLNLHWWVTSSVILLTGFRGFSEFSRLFLWKKSQFLRQITEILANLLESFPSNYQQKNSNRFDSCDIFDKWLRRLWLWYFNKKKMSFIFVICLVTKQMFALAISIVDRLFLRFWLSIDVCDVKFGE